MNNASKRRIILYIAMSLDGYIAAPGDDLSFLDAMQVEGEDYGYAAMYASVDTVIMGRRTYDWLMGQVAVFPHADKEAYIVTRQARPSEGRTHFYDGDLGSLVERLRGTAGGHIFLDGGAMLAQAFMQGDWIDDYVISIVPVCLGQGIPLFSEGRPQRGLHLVSAQAFGSGLVQLHYRRP